jgi:DNA-binding transcriptional MerR regulator
MTALDKTIQLQQQGLSEQEIINTLKEEGISMQEINDALNQANIKNAVSQDPEQTNTDYVASPPAEYANYPTPQETPQETYSPQEAPVGQEYQQYQEYPAQQQSYEGYYPEQGTNNTETITDIAEQVVSKKINELIKTIDGLKESKNLIQRELEELKTKVKRTEDNLDSIQKAIIGKIGEFGESTKMVQKDLENIHGTMSKMMNPLIDNYNELKKLNSKKDR